MRLHELKSREDIGHVLDDIGLTGIGAEIGVERGVHAEMLLETSSLSQIILIDPWKYVSESPPIGFGIGYENWDEIYQECMSRTQRFGGRARLIRSTGSQAIRSIQDESLDFIYLDANHMSPYFDEDLAGWFGKLKRGGIIGGHDYYDRDIPGVFRCDVKSVVGEFFRNLNGEIAITEDDVPSWYFWDHGVSQ